MTIGMRINDHFQRSAVPVSPLPAPPALTPLHVNNNTLMPEETHSPFEWPENEEDDWFGISSTSDEETEQEFADVACSANTADFNTTCTNTSDKDTTSDIQESSDNPTRATSTSRSFSSRMEFALFLKILFKLIDQDKLVQCQAKSIMASFLHKNSMMSLPDMERPLRELVGDSVWICAHHYTKLYQHVRVVRRRRLQRQQAASKDESNSSMIMTMYTSQNESQWVSSSSSSSSSSSCSGGGSVMGDDCQLSSSHHSLPGDYGCQLDENDEQPLTTTTTMQDEDDNMSQQEEEMASPIPESSNGNDDAPILLSYENDAPILLSEEEETMLLLEDI